MPIALLELAATETDAAVAEASMIAFSFARIAMAPLVVTVSLLIEASTELFTSLRANETPIDPPSAFPLAKEAETAALNARALICESSLAFIVTLRDEIVPSSVSLESCVPSIKARILFRILFSVRTPAPESCNALPPIAPTIPTAIASTPASIELVACDVRLRSPVTSIFEFLI